MKECKFSEVPVGAYLTNAIPGSGIWVKRGGWVESIGPLGLVDGGECDVEDDRIVQWLDEQEEWPKIDYTEQVRSEFNWDLIKQEVFKYVDYDGFDVRGRVWMGTIIGLMPSGKIYTFWTTNQTAEDVNRDTAYNEALEAVAEEHGLYLFWDDDCYVGKLLSFAEVGEHHGFEVVQIDNSDRYLWHKGLENCAEDEFETEDLAWEDCCRVNNLVEGM